MFKNIRKAMVDEKDLDQRLNIFYRSFLIIFAVLSASNINATETIKKFDTKHVRTLLQQVFDANAQYKNEFHNIISKATLDKQTPHATVVLCSDSRVDTSIVSEAPAGEIFVVRNIGNQVQTAIGSVTYGVNYLHTELLMIVGHSECGAVKAATQGYRSKSSALQKELDTLEVNPQKSLNYNLIHNVNIQVQAATERFADQLKQGKLVVIGMIHDLHNEFGHGNGQILVVNLNNETDAKILVKNEYLAGLKNVFIAGSQE